MSLTLTDPVRQKLLLAAVALGVMMDGIDGSIVNVALPALATFFATDTGTIAWVVITYLLMMAGLMLVFGKFADRGYAKAIFLLGLAAFTVSSLACGISSALEVLLAARLAQGAGAAMIAAVAPLLCIRHLPEDMRGASLGALAAMCSFGVAIGPVIGGFILQHLSWHWIFLINIPVGIAVILFAARVIPPDEPVRAGGPFDYRGAALFFAGMVLCTFIAEEGLVRGFSDPVIMLAVAAFLACTALFIRQERRVAEPLLNLQVFSSRPFAFVLAAFLLLNVIFLGIFYLLPFYLTTMMHFDPALTGLYLLVPPALIALISIPFGRLSDIRGRRLITIAGCALVVVYNAIFVFIVPASGIIPLLAGLVIMGVAVGIYSGPVSGWLIDLAPAGEEATGSSLMVTVIYFGGVIGTALYAAIFTMATMEEGSVVRFTSLDPARFLDGFHITMAAGLLLAVVILALSYAVPDKSAKF